MMFNYRKHVSGCFLLRFSLLFFFFLSSLGLCSEALLRKKGRKRRIRLMQRNTENKGERQRGMQPILKPRRRIIEGRTPFSPLVYNKTRRGRRRREEKNIRGELLTKYFPAMVMKRGNLVQQVVLHVVSLRRRKKPAWDASQGKHDKRYREISFGSTDRILR